MLQIAHFEKLSFCSGGNLQRILPQVSFWGAPTHADVTEFENALLQLKNQRSGKSLCGTCITLIWKGNKSKTAMSCSMWKKKEGIFCTVYFVWRRFFNICFILMYSALHELSKYTCFHISKALLHALFCLLLKSLKAFSGP